MGQECGKITAWHFSDSEWTCMMQVPSYLCAAGSITRLKFNLRFSQADKEYLVAASSQDHTVRLLKLTKQ